MIALFFTLWAILFGAAVLLIAMVPSTLAVTNRELLWPVDLTGAVSAIVTLCVAGFLSIFF